MLSLLSPDFVVAFSFKLIVLSKPVHFMLVPAQFINHYPTFYSSSADWISFSLTPYDSGLQKTSTFYSKSVETEFSFSALFSHSLAQRPLEAFLNAHHLPTSLTLKTVTSTHHFVELPKYSSLCEGFYLRFSFAKLSSVLNATSL